MEKPWIYNKRIDNKVGIQLAETVILGMKSMTLKIGQVISKTRMIKNRINLNIFYPQKRVRLYQWNKIL